MRPTEGGSAAQISNRLRFECYSRQCYFTGSESRIF